MRTAITPSDGIILTQPPRLSPLAYYGRRAKFGFFTAASATKDYEMIYIYWDDITITRICRWLPKNAGTGRIESMKTRFHYFKKGQHASCIRSRLCQNAALPAWVTANFSLPHCAVYISAFYYISQRWVLSAMILWQYLVMLPRHASQCHYFKQAQDICTRFEFMAQIYAMRYRDYFHVSSSVIIDAMAFHASTLLFAAASIWTLKSFSYPRVMPPPVLAYFAMRRCIIYIGDTFTPMIYEKASCFHTFIVEKRRTFHAIGRGIYFFDAFYVPMLSR